MLAVVASHTRRSKSVEAVSVLLERPVGVTPLMCSRPVYLHFTIRQIGHALARAVTSSRLHIP